ncbi:hypothetical protein [Weissella viridescens]|uniref:hypothetical protein n=1 Tax=Weissella viridescens TaxID=1629 RepID=UPI003AF21573
MAFDSEQVRKMKAQLDSELPTQPERRTQRIPSTSLQTGNNREFKRACNIMLKPSTKHTGQQAAQNLGLSLSNYIEELILKDNNQ